MFETMTDRIAGTVLMGLDVAVEFATLGEFRLVEAERSPTPDLFQAAPLVRPPASPPPITPVPPRDHPRRPAAPAALHRDPPRCPGLRSARSPAPQAGGAATEPGCEGRG